MAISQSVGTTLEVAASWPATDDQSGYEALSFVTAGKLSSLPAARGTKDEATFDDLATGDEIKLIDMKRGGTGTVTFARDDEDAGQDIFETAATDTTNTGSRVAIKMTFKNGEIYYRKASVLSYTPQAAVGQVMTAEVNLSFSSDGDVGPISV